MKKTPTVDYSARHDSFERWFQTPLGRSLLASQRAVLDHELGAMAGARQLQVGVSHRLPLATSTDFAQKIITTPAWHPNMPDGAAVCDADELPFPGDSMDLVVLHHTADFSPYPHQVLREAARVLRGEGVIALIGFNPFSLWGIRHLLSRQRQGPWGGRFLMRSRMEDWLTLLGCEMESSSTHFCSLPLQRRHRRSGPGRAKRKCSASLLPVGAYYCILARKRVPARIGKRRPWRRANVLPIPGTIGAPTGYAGPSGRALEQKRKGRESRWQAK